MITTDDSKKKTALLLLYWFVGIICSFTIVILLRDFILFAIFITTAIASIGLTAWGLWDELWPEIHARDKMINDLYEHANSEEHKKWIKFFIEYFKL